MEKYAYLTVLTTASYIPGIAALKKSLQRTNPKYPLMILIPESQKNELKPILERNNIIDERCYLLIKPDIDSKYFSNLKNKKNHYWNNTFFKLVSTSCTEFKKIVMLDSDIYIRKNIDDLFNRPTYSACVAGHAMVRKWVKLASGLMVLEPNINLYNKLLDCIKPTIERRSKNNLPVGDQDIFQEAYPDWEKHNELLIPETYSCMFHHTIAVCRFYKIEYNGIFILHFDGKSKPWMRSKFKNIVRLLCLIMSFQYKKAKDYSAYLKLVKIY